MEIKPTTINRVALVCLKEIAARDPALRDRDFCLFSVAETANHTQFILSIMDRNTSLFTAIPLEKHNPIYGTKPVIYGIIRKILDNFLKTIPTQKVKVFHLSKDCLTAQGRRSIYEATIKIPNGKGKIYLFAWGKFIITP